MKIVTILANISVILALGVYLVSLFALPDVLRGGQNFFKRQIVFVAFNSIMFELGGWKRFLIVAYAALLVVLTYYAISPSLHYVLFTLYAMWFTTTLTLRPKIKELYSSEIEFALTFIK